MIDDDETHRTLGDEQLDNLSHAFERLRRIAGPDGYVSIYVFMPSEARFADCGPPDEKIHLVGEDATFKLGIVKYDLSGGRIRLLGPLAGDASPSSNFERLLLAVSA